MQISANERTKKNKNPRKQQFARLTHIRLNQTKQNKTKRNHTLRFSRFHSASPCDNFDTECRTAESKRTRWHASRWERNGRERANDKSIVVIYEFVVCTAVRFQV